MKLQPKVLLHLTMEHPYYNQSWVGSTFELEKYPKNTSHNIFINQANPKFRVFAKDSIAVNKYQLINLKIKDSNFWNVTNLNFNEQQVLFLYEANEEGIVRVDNENWLPILETSFNLQLTPKELNQLVDIQFNALGQDWSGKLSIEDLIHGQNLRYDIRNLPPWGYQISLNFGSQNKVYRFFKLNASVINLSPIFLGLSFDETKVVKWQLQFPDRAVIWRYYFLNVKPSEWQQFTILPLKIDDGKEEINFHQVAEKKRLPNGELAHLIYSEKPIPLREKPPWLVKLQGMTVKKIMTLPYPQTQLIRTDFIPPKSRTRFFCADVYIQI